MAESEVTETKFRFEEIDDSSVKVSVIGPNGAKPFEAQLNNVTWGMLEDIVTMQDEAERDMRAIFGFFNKYVEGGGGAVPIKYTMPFFESIAAYMNEVMNTQKN